MFNLFSRSDVAIDLGTARTKIYLKGKGVLMDEPTIVAINTRSDQIIAIGESALKMEGKSPAHIMVTRPINSGIVTDFEIAERMVKNLLDRLFQTTFYGVRPRIITNVPLDVTEVEKKSLEDIMWQVGAKKVYLIERPIAAAIGCSLPIQDACASLIVEMGAGLTEIAVISLSGIVSWRSLKFGGESLDFSIINYIREKYGLLLGKRTAEDLKIKIGSAIADKPIEMRVKGRDLQSGLPKEIKVSNEEIKETIIGPLKNIVENIRETIEQTPPELVSDIYERGMVISGGPALLPGLVKFLEKEIKIPIHLAHEPGQSVIHGLGMVLEDFNNLKDVVIPLTDE